jgi:phosphate:Na+ symporter
MLGAIGGNVSSESLGNFLFNLFVTIFAYLLLHPILLLITDFFYISDPLIALVLFSTINLGSIIIFIPY